MINYKSQFFISSHNQPSHNQPSHLPSHQPSQNPIRFDLDEIVNWLMMMVDDEMKKMRWW